MCEQIIQANNLTKLYGNKYAVKNCTFNVNKGQIVGLVGLNGAGKTTLIRLLTAVISPTSGSFSLFSTPNGKDLHSVLDKVSCMIEHPALYKNLSGTDNLLCSCQLKGVYNPIDSGYIKEKMKFVGLEDEYLSTKKVDKYSLGMKQRLGIAMATINEPELMILDEPTNGLDPEGIQEFRNLLIKINKQNGTTLLVSSHILSELEKFAQSYIFIDKGTIKEQIDAIELEKTIGSTIILSTNVNDKVFQLLIEKGYEVERKDDSLYIYHANDIASLLNDINSIKVVFNFIREEKMTLEDHFLSLIGEIE